MTLPPSPSRLPGCRLEAIPRRVDVCVIGGGPAGAAAAVTARSTGAQVCMITKPSSSAAFLELISGRAHRVLDTLGILELVSTIAEPCVGSVSRWTGMGFDEHSSLLDPGGGGWIVDRDTFDNAIRAEALRSGVSVLPDRVAKIDESAGRYRVRLPDRDILADKIILAAGSRRGPARHTCDRLVRQRIVALRVRLGPAVIAGLGNRLLVDRGPSGWWYAIANASATDIVYCTDGVVLAKGAEGIRTLWRMACAGSTDWLPRGAAMQQPRVRAATIGSGWPRVDGRMRLVGDAALSVDPLSGRGITLALEGASRCDDPDYPDWIAETAREHDRIQREVYRAACAVAGHFWEKRRM